MLRKTNNNVDDDLFAIGDDNGCYCENTNTTVTNTNEI